MKKNIKTIIIIIIFIIIIALYHNKINTKEINNIIIGVQLGTISDINITNNFMKTIEIKRYNKPIQIIQALKKNQIDCAIIDEEPAKKFIKFNKNLEIIKHQFYKEKYAICMHKNNINLINKFNKELKKLKNNGILINIMQHYINKKKYKFNYFIHKHYNKTLIMAVNAEFEPWAYYNKKNIIGIDIDIARIICNKLKYNLKIFDMEFESIIPAIQTKKVDFGASGMTINKERINNIGFTNTYAITQQVIIIKK